MRAIRCPYCFNLTGNVQAFRCINPSATACPPEEDVKLANYQGLRQPLYLSRVVERPLRFGVLRTHDALCACGLHSTLQVCPECHNELPSQFEKWDKFIIALIGPSFAGKSVYTSVLIHELMNRVGSAFDAAITALDDQTLRRYKRTYHGRLFLEQTELERTDSARANVENKYPLVYKWAMHRRGKNSSALVFFDAAGEDLVRLDTMSTQANYISWADGMIFLFDPLQITVVRDQLRQFTRVPAEKTDPRVILPLATELIRSTRNIPQTKKIAMPIAFTFSKIDAIRELLDDGSPLTRSSNHQGFFDTEDQRQVHEALRGYVNEWLGDEFERYIEKNYAHYSYFGVSSLGRPPDLDGAVSFAIAPFRVEDPLLWLLYNNGIIKSR